MATSADDEYLDSQATQVEKESDAYLDSFASAPTAHETSTADVMAGNPNVADVRAAMGPASPEKGRDFGVGLLRGAANVGNTLLNAIDPLAQKMEDVFGTPVGPTVAEARARRDDATRLYREEYGEGHPGATVGEVAGETLLTAPPLIRGGNLLVGGLKSAPAVEKGLVWLQKTPVGRFVERAATGAALGGGTAAMLTGGRPDEPAGEQIAEGAGIGALLNPVLAPMVGAVAETGTKAYNYLKSLASKMGRSEGASGANPLAGTTGDALVDALKSHGRDLGTLSPGVQSSVAKEASEQIAATGSADADALARKANLEELGLKVHKSMVTRDPLDWANAQELAKTPAGKQLADDLIANNEKIAQHLQKIADDAGGSANTPYDAAENVVKEVKKTYEMRSTAVSEEYTALESKHGQEAGISPDKLLRKLKQSASRALSEPGQGPNQGLLASVKNELMELGLIKKDGSPVLLKSGKPKTLTVNQANTLRKFINNSSAPGKNMQAIKRDLVESVDDSVSKAVGEDVFAPARAAHRAKIEEFEDEVTSSKMLRDIMDGNVTADNLIDRHIFGKSATAEDLSKFMKTTGVNTQAVKDLKQQVAERILSDSRVASGEITYDKLFRTLKKIGPQKLEILFGKEGANRYTSLLSALRDTTVAPARAPVNYSNTANELFRRVSNLLEEGSTPMMMSSAAMGEPTGILAAMIPKVARGMGKKAEDRAVQRAVEAELSGSAVASAQDAVALDPRINKLIQNTTVPAAVSSYNALYGK